MIRQCDAHDFEALFAVVNAAAEAYRGVIPADRWQEPYMGRAELQGELDAGVSFWGYEQDGALVGAMGLQERGEVALIRHAYVLPRCQRQGIGARLLRQLERQTDKPLLVGTWADADWAVAFYRAHGYAQVAPGDKERLLRRYWQIPERQIETSVVLRKAARSGPRPEVLPGLPYPQCLDDPAAAPATRTSLAADLARLGVQPGSTLIVQSSLSALGYVVGAPVAVVLALEDALGPEGTLAMPAHTGELTDPSFGDPRPIPEAWRSTVRATMPAFDPAMTPAKQMGAIADCFRTQRGALRSRHPFVSWAARGPQARRITARHQLANSSGEGSPLARLYELDAQVLLLGAGWDSNTSFHLAEYRCRFAPLKHYRRGAALQARGQTRWMEYDDIYLYDQDFVAMGEEFERLPGAVSVGRVGHAVARLFSQRRLVDFAVRWMNENRWLD